MHTDILQMAGKLDGKAYIELRQRKNENKRDALALMWTLLAYYTYKVLVILEVEAQTLMITR